MGENGVRRCFVWDTAAKGNGPRRRTMNGGRRIDDVKLVTAEAEAVRLRLLGRASFFWGALMKGTKFLLLSCCKDALVAK